MDMSCFWEKSQAMIVPITAILVFAGLFVGASHLALRSRRPILWFPIVCAVGIYAMVAIGSALECAGFLTSN